MNPLRVFCIGGRIVAVIRQYVVVAVIAIVFGSLPSVAAVIYAGPDSVIWGRSTHHPLFPDAKFCNTVDCNQALLQSRVIRAWQENDPPDVDLLRAELDADGKPKAFGGGTPLGAIHWRTLLPNGTQTGIESADAGQIKVRNVWSYGTGQYSRQVGGTMEFLVGMFGVDDPQPVFRLKGDGGYVEVFFNHLKEYDDQQGNARRGWRYLKAGDLNSARQNYRLLMIEN